MRIKTILILILSIFSAIAQTTQPGIVQEYNEKAKKTPLAGVEVRAKSANNAASGKDGKFELQFLTLKPGDRVNVSRIEKLGYEIFNKEAIEQWNINPKTPFVVVMCKSDKFKKIRDNYEAKASENYNKQYKKEIADLNKLKEEGKIKDEEYRKSLQEIQSTYDKQRENLENYIDRFARIDLSEISSQEQEIIELVQQGRFEEAIAKYEAQNYVDKYIREIDDITEISSAIGLLNKTKESKEQSKDSILAFVSRYLDMLQLAGGIENNKKIYEVYRKIADKDSTNAGWLLKAGNFIRVYFAENSTALSYYQKVLNASLSDDGENNLDVASSYNGIGHIYYDEYKLYLALEYFEKDLDIKKNLLGENHPDMIETYNDIGLIYLEQSNYDEALFFFEKASDILEDVFGEDYQNIRKCYDNKGRVYYEQGKYVEALELYDRALKIKFNVFGETHLDVAKSYEYIGLVYCDQERYDDAMDVFEKSLKIRLEILGENHPDVAINYDNMGFVYLKQGNGTEALYAYEKALRIKLMTFTKYNDGFRRDDLLDKIINEYNKPEDEDWHTYPNKGMNNVYLSASLENPFAMSIYDTIASIFYIKGKYTAALYCYNLGSFIQNVLFGHNHPNNARYGIKMGDALYRNGDYEEAISFYTFAMKQYREKFGDYHPQLTKIQYKINEIQEKMHTHKEE